MERLTGRAIAERKALSELAAGAELFVVRRDRGGPFHVLIYVEDSGLWDIELDRSKSEATRVYNDLTRFANWLDRKYVPVSAVTMVVEPYEDFIRRHPEWVRRSEFRFVIDRQND